MTPAPVSRPAAVAALLVLAAAAALPQKPAVADLPAKARQVQEAHAASVVRVTATVKQDMAGFGIQLGGAGSESTVDAIGTVVGTAGVGSLTFAVLQGPRWGWTSSGLGIAAAVCVVLLAWFFVRCARSANPLLDLSLFRHRPFATANLSQAGTQMAIFSWFFTTPLFLINVWEYSAFAGGSAVAIGMLISFVSIPVGRYSDRAGYRHVLVAGGVVTAAGMFWWLLFVDATPNYLYDYLPGLFLFGVGAGMVGIVVTNAALAGLPEASLASANAVFQTIRRLLGAIGVALAVALLGGDRTTDSVEAFRRTWWLVAGGYLFSLVGALAYPAGERRRRRA